MLPELEVQLTTGQMALCQVVESGIRTLAKFNGREFEIERRLGAWRERDRMHWRDTRAGASKEVWCVDPRDARMDELANEIHRLRGALDKIARRWPCDNADTMSRLARETLGERCSKCART